MDLLHSFFLMLVLSLGSTQVLQTSQPGRPRKIPIFLIFQSNPGVFAIWTSKRTNSLPWAIQHLSRTWLSCWISCFHVTLCSSAFRDSWAGLPGGEDMVTRPFPDSFHTFPYIHTLRYPKKNGWGLKNTTLTTQQLFDLLQELCTIFLQPFFKAGHLQLT